MQAHWPLGNDIVDVQLPDNVKSAANRQYIERVLAPQELTMHPWLSEPVANTHQLAFWAFWAAKESAYKTLNKTTTAPIFAHRRFAVRPDEPIVKFSTPGKMYGTVMHESVCIPVYWEWNNDWVHCLAGVIENTPTQILRYRVDELLTISQRTDFNRKKYPNAMSDASIAVRLQALSLLKELGVVDAHIIRKQREHRTGPPEIEQHGKMLTSTDVSLSHDGRFVSAAVTQIT